MVGASGVLLASAVTFQTFAQESVPAQSDTGSLFCADGIDLVPVDGGVQATCKVAATVPAPTTTIAPTTTTIAPTTTTIAPTTTTIAPTTTTIAPTTTTIAPTTTVPAPAPHHGVSVDESAIPPSVGGLSTFRIGKTSLSPTRASDGVGAFRINCTYSHMNFDDPIVFPGGVRATHLHTYAGNTDVNAHSTSSSIADSGNSTCSGGTANRSAYWAPTMVDTTSSRPIAPTGDHGVQIYYKVGYQGVVADQIRNMPAGLRIVAGDANRSTPLQHDWMSRVTYSCVGSGPSNRSQSIPSCPAGDVLVMTVVFPQCWDGVNLDSADHKSHMQYGTWGRVPGAPGTGCPASHPVAIPEITQNFRYTVPAGGTSNWRLSSDTYSGPAGYSGHADWWNGWDAPTFQRVVDNCLVRSLDCQMNLLGDGYRLTF